MPIVAVFEAPGLTRENYEERVRRITGGKQRMSSRSDWREKLIPVLARARHRGTARSIPVTYCRHGVNGRGCGEGRERLQTSRPS